MDLFQELEVIFPDRRKRFLVGFSRGAMSSVECQFSVPTFSFLHILIAPYYPSEQSHPEKPLLQQIAASYAENRVDIWYLYGEHDQWVRDVKDLRQKLELYQKKWMKELLDEVQLPGFDHDASFAYLTENPGHLWIWLDERLDDLGEIMQDRSDVTTYFDSDVEESRRENDRVPPEPEVP